MDRSRRQSAEHRVHAEQTPNPALWAPGIARATGWLVGRARHPPESGSLCEACYRAVRRLGDLGCIHWHRRGSLDCAVPDSDRARRSPSRRPGVDRAGPEVSSATRFRLVWRPRRGERPGSIPVGLARGSQQLARAGISGRSDTRVHPGFGSADGRGATQGPARWKNTGPRWHSSLRDGGVR